MMTMVKKKTADERIFEAVNNSPFEKKTKSKSKDNNDNFDFKLALIEIKADLEMTHKGIEFMKEDFSNKMENMKNIYDNFAVNINEKVNRIDKNINGNGKPGLSDVVIQNKEDISNLKNTNAIKKDGHARMVSYAAILITLIGSIVIPLIFKYLV